MSESSPAIRVVRWYQRAAEGRLSPCRFYPSCSSYAVEALEVHGTRRGLWLTVRRLVRCRPFGPSGFDPVPEADDTMTQMVMTTPRAMTNRVAMNSDEMGAVNTLVDTAPAERVR
jgi:putative membrane protein insertion efficiency factor